MAGDNGPRAAELTRNQSLVLGVLSRAQAPMSAYDILDRLREEGLRSPLQVYRALTPLVGAGRVHRLESLSAFVACAHDHGHAQPMIGFAICDNCGHVEEFSDETVAHRLTGWAKERDFAIAATTLELRGTCVACRAAA